MHVCKADTAPVGLVKVLMCTGLSSLLALAYPSLSSILRQVLGFNRRGLQLCYHCRSSHIGTASQSTLRLHSWTGDVYFCLCYRVLFVERSRWYLREAAAGGINLTLLNWVFPRKVFLGRRGKVRAQAAYCWRGSTHFMIANAQKSSQ